MDILTSEQKYIIKNINDKYVRKGIFNREYNILFGGSISLLSCGLINRPIGDIDIFVSNSSTYTNLINDILGHARIGPCNLCPGKKYSEVAIDSKLNQYQRTGLEIKIGDSIVKLCIFLVSKENIESYNIYEVSAGVSIPVQQVNHAIHAKILYAQRNSPSGDKHKMDIENVYAILNSAFFMISGEELT